VSERGLRLAGACLAVAGAGVSVYLLVARETGGSPVCSTGGCEVVQSSPYAEVLGVPVAAVALAGFAAFLVFALARGERARLAQATVAIAAVLFGGYLLAVQAFAIGAFCQWCLATDAITTLLAALALLRLRRSFA
jgi:uncharacterized membrane protein